MLDKIKSQVSSLFKKGAQNDDTFADGIESDEYLLTALAPDYIKEFDNYVQLGANYTRTLIVMDFQTVLSREAIQSLSEINSNVSITTFFSRANNAEIRNKMAKAIKQSKNKQNDHNLDEASKVEADLQSDDARSVIVEMAAGNEQMYLGHLLIHINARNVEELERLTQNVKSVVGTVGTAYSPNKKAFDAYESFLPLGKNKVKDLSYRLMNSEAVAYFFPLHENEMFDEGGFFVGINEKTRNAVLVDQRKLMNKHKVVIGMSGLGKSTAVFKDVSIEWMNGVKIKAIDPKGEFGPVFRNMGGVHVRFDMTGTTRINMFDLPKKKLSDIDDEIGYSENPIYNKIPKLLTTFKLMYPKLNETQYNIVSALLENTYKNKNIDEHTDLKKLMNTDLPTFTDFDNEILKLKKESPESYEYIREFHLSIQVFVNGIYSKVFNAHTNVDVDNDLVAYDTLSFYSNKEILRVLYFIIMDYMTNEAINGNGEDARYIFDETHVIADPKIPTAMEQLFFMMKVLRSFNVGVTTATQSVKDYLSAKDESRNYGEAIISQSVQRYYLPMEPAEIRFLEKELAHEFSVKERSILTVRDGNKEKQAGKGILFVGAKKIQCSVKLNHAEAELWFNKKKHTEIKL